MGVDATDVSSSSLSLSTMIPSGDRALLTLPVDSESTSTISCSVSFWGISEGLLNNTVKR